MPALLMERFAADRHQSCVNGRGPIVWLLISFLAVGCSRDPEARKASYMASGDRYLADSKLREAVVEYRNAVQVDQRFGPGRVRLAETYAKLGDINNAFAEYIRAADLLPNDISVQLIAGNYLLAARRPSDALSRAEAALAIDPGNVEAHVLRGNALGGLNEFEKALAEIEEALRLDPSRGSTYAQLGLMQSARGSAADAQKAFETAVRLAPDWVQGHLALANHFWATGKPADAEARLKAALQLEPSHALANRAMATFLITAGRTGEAEPYLKQLAEKSTAGTLALADYYIQAHRVPEALDRLKPLMDGKVVPGAKRRMAKAYVAAGDYAKAHAVLDDALKSDPKDLDARLLKAQLLAEKGGIDEAFGHVRGAVEADASSAAAHYALGTMHAARGDVAGAEQAFQETLRLNPRAAAAQAQIANLQLAKGDVSDALESAREATKSEPRNVTARLALVRSLIAAKDFNKAEQEVLGVIAAAPDNVSAQVLRGLVAAERKDTTAARVAFERARSIDAKSIELLAAEMAFELAGGNPAAAKAKADARLADGPPSTELLILAARTYVSAKDLPGAERLLRQAIDRDPSIVQAYSLLGQLYLAQRKLDAARQEFDELATRLTRPVAALTMAGTILQAQGDTAGARDRFERAMAADPRAAVAANNLAWMYAEAGDNLDGALQLAQTAVTGLPEAPEPSDTLGWVYLKKRLPDLARPAFARAVEKSPRNPVYHYHLGLAYEQAGERENAQRSLRRALELSSRFVGADDARQVLDRLTAGSGQ